MKLLLDTHLLLWAVQGSSRLPDEVAGLIRDQRNELWFSAASIWEIAIKHTARRPGWAAEPHMVRRALLDHLYTELSITSEHALAVAALPPVHKDPFDRILVAQATVEGVPLLTSDRRVADYPGPVRQVR